MSQRYIFFDVLRGLAVLWMIQVHVTNVFLEPALRAGSLFNLLNLSNGFVAPAFIFCAGGGLWIALQRKGAAYLQFDSSLWQYAKRLGVVLAWGYALHFPVFVYGNITGLTSDQWFTGLQIDVLHTIVYSSLTALAAFFVVRSVKVFTYAMLAMALVVSCLSVFFLTQPPTSPFPLLPWSAYLFAGAGAMGLFMGAEDKGRLAKIFVVGGLLTPLIIFWVKGLQIPSPWTDVWWQASPGSQLFRISGIAVVFGALFLAENTLSASSTGRLLQVMGQESLFLYVSHLLIVYSWGPLISESLFGFRYLDPVGVVVIWIGVTIPLVAFSMWWRSYKHSRKGASR